MPLDYVLSGSRLWLPAQVFMRRPSSHKPKAIPKRVENVLPELLRLQRTYARAQHSGRINQSCETNRS